MTDNIPYLLIPTLVAFSTFVSAAVKERYSIPEDEDPNQPAMPIKLNFALPFLLGGAALAAPAAVSLNWYIAEFFAMI